MATRIAGALRVDPAWLLGTTPPRSSSGGAPRREREEMKPSWWFPKPIEGQRDYGNSNVWTVPATIATLVRETTQNSMDAALDTTSQVVMRFRLIDLEGKDVERFKAAIGFEQLEAHVTSASKSKGKLASTLSVGLKRVQKGKRLRLLRIDDFNTKGLKGPETGAGAFAALVRNNLDSEKQSKGAGGSYGLGKAALWRCSDLSTVLFYSQPQGDEDRLIARSELTYHEMGERHCAGPGWFGVQGKHGELHESVRNSSDLARDLFLFRDALPEQLQAKTQGTGTSILVVAFEDPASEGESKAEDILRQLKEESARHFWPAMMTKRLAVVVEHFVGKDKRSEAVVTPNEYAFEFCAAFERHRLDEVVTKLAEPGDVARDSVPLVVPACEPEREELVEYGATEANATLLVRLADADSASSAGWGTNHVALIRGAHMVTQYWKRDGLVIGGRPFHAVLLAGSAADASTESKAAEQFLRAAEPPAHDKWEYTDDVRANYNRGAKTRLHDFHVALSQRLREWIKAPSVKELEGPEALRKLLTLSLPAESDGLLSLRNVTAEVQGNTWRVRGDVVLRGDRVPEGQLLRIRPRLAFDAETGNPLVVPWTTLGLHKGEVVLDAGAFKATKKTKRFTFEGTSEGGIPGLDPARCVARVSVTYDLVGPEAQP